MIYNKKVTAIVLAAGRSTRFGKVLNKVLQMLDGKPVVSYSLKEFDENDKIDEIILMINPLEEKEVEVILSKLNIKKKLIIVNGGDTRKQSVNNGLNVASGDIVIVHDSARPLITQDYINRCLEEMKDFKGVAIAVKAKDTIKITDDNGIVETTTKRANTWLVQTPQCFDKEVLLNIHKKYESDDTITDDCMLLELEGLSVKLIEGKYTNIKVTTIEDIDFLESVMKKNF